MCNLLSISLIFVLDSILPHKKAQAPLENNEFCEKEQEPVIKKFNKFLKQSW